MTQDEIVKMAREAGLCVGTNLSGVVLVGAPAEIGLAHLTIEDLERFAALVAAAEREACAAMAEAFHHHQYDFTGNLELHEAIRARSEQCG